MTMHTVSPNVRVSCKHHAVLYHSTHVQYKYDVMRLLLCT